MSIKKKILLIVIIFILIIVIITFRVKLNTSKEETTKNLVDNNIEIAEETKDTISPIIVLDDTYVVKTGFSKNLVDVIMSADDIDSSPKREIIGEYDLNVAEEYSLTYKIEDSSGNITTKDFVLKVKDDYTYSEEDIEFDEAVNTYKTEDTKIGIDVSKWQGEIDWEKVANAGTEFAIIRMGYQNGFDGDLLLDPYFLANIESCKEKNIPIAVYFSSYAKTQEEAKNQAIWVCENLKNNNYTNLSVSFDWENWSSFNTLNLSLKDINNIADTFMNETKDLDYNPILYGSKTYLEAVWENSNNYQVWLANYVKETSYQGSYKIWQFCQTGVIDGISGYVDINVMYKK